MQSLGADRRELQMSHMNALYSVFLSWIMLQVFASLFKNSAIEQDHFTQELLCVILRNEGKQYKF